MEDYAFLHSSDFLSFELLYCLIGLLWTKKSLHGWLFSPWFLNFFSEKRDREEGNTIEDAFLTKYNNILCIGAQSRKFASWTCDVDISVKKNKYVVSVSTVKPYFAWVHPHWN